MVDAHGEPLQEIVVMGATVSAEIAVAPIVWNAAPAGAPPDCPAFCTQLRNVFRSARSIQPDEAVQVL